MKKTVIILNKPKGARLANQLWNFVSVYAYCIEKGYDCKNYSFFEDKKQENRPNSLKTYYKFFNIPHIINTKFFLWLHVLLSKISQKPRLYYRYVEFIKRKHPDKIIYSGDENVFFLPPTTNNNQKQMQKIKDFEEGTESTLYLDGWLFRNPDGTEKYHDQIQEYFRPNHKTTEYTKNLITPLRKKYRKIIGVHIRQSDYKKLFVQGKYYFNEKEVRKILDEYLVFADLKPSDVIFLTCSDEKVDISPFLGLNHIMAMGNEAEDLFTLASCDLILGSRSTYGPWAALYGNIPFIMFERDMDWEYYKHKGMDQYFDNEKVGLLS